ncbi:uncharacterized protein LOC126092435 [Schistocerca cancellata]|uniref:uncharacterized protein LOC126092435 n=1 Tax=Schistocerca cancellata TaxID=274614 RepID=UPI0021188ABE|nr:uncharacterized protein LOC126092435 [Schistocerca cancellata]
MEIKSWFVIWLYILSLFAQKILCDNQLLQKVQEIKGCIHGSCKGKFPVSSDSPNMMDNRTFSAARCFCDDECHLYRDCCPDKVTEVELQQEPVSPILWDCAGWQNGSNPHTLYMVRSCPFQDRFSKLCTLEGIPEEKYDYKFDVPVLNTRTGVWYQNIFCAICHNQDDDLASLTLKFDCTDNLTMKQAITHGRYEPHSLTWKMTNDVRSPMCKLNVVLADDGGIMKGSRRCIKHEHKCAANWTDIAVKKLCHSYSFIVYTLKFGNRRKYYKNPHCALCNYVEPEEMNCIFDVSIRAPRLPSLSLVLKLNWDPDSQTMQQANCQLPHGVYDPLHGKCMRIEDACDDDYVFEDGKCIPNPDRQKRKTRSHTNQSSILNVSCFVITLAPDEFILLNDSIQLTLNTSNAVIPNGLFEIFDNGYAKVCNVFDIPYSKDIFKGYVSTVCLSLSVICLILHSAIFCLVPKLRNLPAMNLFSLTTALLLAQLIFLLGIYPVAPVPHSLCVTIAILIHYLFLSSFFWMNAMSLDIWRTFGAKGYSSGTRCHYWKYAIYAWGIPLLIVVLAVVFDNTSTFPMHLRPHYAEHKMTCWFGNPLGLLIYLVAPMFVIVVINIVFFGITIYRLHEMKLSIKFIKRKRKNENCETSQSTRQTMPVQASGGISGNRDKIRFYLYLKLFIIMGLTWVSGIIAIFSEVEAVWYIFVILNGLQGTFIFFMFDCKQKIGSLLWEKLLGGKFEQPNFLKNFSVSGKQATNTRCTASSQTKSCSVSSTRSVSSDKMTVVKMSSSENMESNKRKLEPEEIPLKLAPKNGGNSSFNLALNPAFTSD